MATIFEDGVRVENDWLNKVSRTVTDGLGDKNTPAEIRVHIGAEKSGAAGSVQADLNSHKNDTNIHFPKGDVVLQSEKGTPYGIPVLDGTSKVPAAFLPPTGGYAGIYDTQALMVAAGAGHLNGQIFLVTDDPTSTLNGEYTATVDAPTVIGDYYFNSGAIAPHAHPASEVNVTALGVTVEDDSTAIHAELDLTATASELASHAGDASIHYADVTIASKQYARTTNGWEEVVAGSGDLKADFSVQMVGNPSLGQDIATRSSSEEVFTDRLKGYLATGILENDQQAAITDADSIIRNSAYYVYPGRVANLPAGLAKIRYVLTTYDVGGSYGLQTLQLSDFDTVGNESGIWRRGREVGIWGAWSQITAASIFFDNTASGYAATDAQDAIDEGAAMAGGLSHWSGTQAEYDALGAWDNNTVYNIT